MTRKLPLLAAVAAAALALAACEERREAGIAAPEPAPLGQLAYEAGLPAAPPTPVRWSEPEAGYEWADRAYGLQETFYDEPPAYGFDYGDSDPWVWRTADDREMYAEPWDDGYRYYYYEPGADYPYFVQDDGYGYAFDNGLLVAVITVAGAYLAADRFDDFAPAAGRYYAHGYELRRAARRAPRIPVVETVWAERAPIIARSAGPWLKAPKADKRWKEWREAKGPRERIVAVRSIDDRGARPFQPAHAGRQDGPRADKGPKRSQEVREARREARVERQAERRQDRGPPARAAEAQGRPAAAAAQGGREARPDRGKDHGGPKADGGGKPGKGPDHGGGHPGGKGEGGGKGGGKKD